jgi:hypothetical protein
MSLTWKIFQKVIIERGLKLVTKEARFDIAKEGIAAFQHWMDLSKKSSTK